jgi:hypothetical protein
VHESAPDPAGDWIRDVAGEQLGAAARARTNDLVCHDLAGISGTSGFYAVDAFVHVAPPDLLRRHAGLHMGYFTPSRKRSRPARLSIFIDCDNAKANMVKDCVSGCLRTSEIMELIASLIALAGSPST